MRKIFWILLLGNAIVFALIQRGWLGWFDQEQQAQPALHGEMINLVPNGVSDKMQPAPVRQVTKPAPAPAQVTATLASPPKLQLVPNMPTPAAGSPNTSVCKEWGDFSGPELARAATALSALRLGDKLSQHQVERDIGYWVYIPPLKNKAAANQKIAELKARGIREYFIIQIVGPWRNAISLGVFKTREAAQNFLNHLSTKAVHSAKVGERASKLKATIFKLNKIDAATDAKLTAIQKDFSGSELKNVPCIISGIH